MTAWEAVALVVKLMIKGIAIKGLDLLMLRLLFLKKIVPDVHVYKIVDVVKGIVNGL
jgi:hypothetical protein